ncbi:MAG: DUF4062 domain-containing protein [Oscillospiraceae bacterium]|nr:DUF4062 domain-containing protein [Oscillospiraceae bacterium]
MKKYQIFISSTYEDLRNERKALMERLLYRAYIPIGMEMFGAASVPSWKIVQKTMDQSDYCVLIVGFKYGSLTEEGKSFTEREYDYACKNSIPIISFIREGDLSSVEEDEREKLTNFISKIKNKQCGFWRTRNELIKAVEHALGEEIKRCKRPGYYRYDEQQNIEKHEVQYIFITALPGTSAESMWEKAKQQLQFRDVIPEKEKILEWDIIKMLERTYPGENIESIEKEHIPDIHIYLKEKKKKLFPRKICLFYAGPVGVALHIGCMFANWAEPIEIFQKEHRGGGYQPLGFLPK